MKLQCRSPTNLFNISPIKSFNNLLLEGLLTMEKRKFVPKMKKNNTNEVKNIQLPKIQIRFPEGGENNVVAFVTLVFYNSFVVTGFKVIWGKKGLFVAAPSRQGSTSYYDIAYPITKEYRKALYDAILAEVTRQVDIEPWEENETQEDIAELNRLEEEETL